jgi:HlyD family secretion protein
MSTKKIFIILGSLVVVLLIISLLKGKKSKEIKVSTEEVSKGTVTEMVSAIGKVHPELEVKISPDVPGEIISIEVEEGDSVSKGDLLLKINPELMKSTLDQMNASLSGSMANLATSEAQLVRARQTYTLAKSNFDRNKKLLKDKVISQQEFETAKTAFINSEADLRVAEKTVEASRYTVQSSRARLNEANENLRRTSIYAPVNGIVSALFSELGERVVGTSQMAGTEMLRIADLNNMEVRVDVSENDIVRVELNDTAVIEVDAFENRKFKGIVTEIANSATVTQGINTDQATNFVVKIRILRSSYADLLEKSKFPFRPGMSAAVEIITETKKDVIAIPISAVTKRTREEIGLDSDTTKRDSTSKDKVTDDDEFEYVFIVKGNVVKARKVKTGIQDSELIRIEKGLKEGEEIVTLSYLAVDRLLKDGSEIKVLPKDKLFDFEE